jgi:hypothetical protein
MYSSRAVKLADFIRTLPDLNLKPPESRSYGHMGATLTDAVLQSGLNYRTVVYPRVRSVMERFPSAKSTGSFWIVLETHTPATVLNWSHPEKLRRLLELASLLLDRQVQTECDLGRWIMAPGNVETLLSIKGIGRKTVDYIKLLTGVPTIAVDRHVQKLMTMAGVKANGYDEIKSIVLESAEIIKLEAGTLDYCLWRHLSKRN